MEFSVERWQEPEHPGEESLREMYRVEGLAPYIWSNAPGDRYSEHSHPYHKILYVVQGSISWILPDLGDEIKTRPGDRINLPRGVVHAAHVGPEGVSCMEAHLD